MLCHRSSDAPPDTLLWHDPRPVIATLLENAMAPVAMAARRGRGRPPKPPTTHFAVWFDNVLRSKHVTRMWLAEKLSVSPESISRFVEGKMNPLRLFTHYDIMDVLELSATKRRTFIRLAVHAGIALYAGPHVGKFGKDDLEYAQKRAEELQHDLMHGLAPSVRVEAQKTFDRLMQHYPEHKDEQVATIQLRYGFLLGAAQEASLPWFQRPQATIETYTRMQDEILSAFDFTTFIPARASLLERRAPLRREAGHYEEGILEFDDALFFARDEHDPTLIVTLYRNRAHISAVTGDRKTWEEDLTRALNYAQRLRSPLREEQIALVGYSRAEGFKRLAYGTSASISLAQREKYARQAYQEFLKVQHLEATQWEAHGILAAVSDAQCLIWLDPRAALQRLQQVRIPAQQTYPSLIAKIDLAESFAWQRLNATRRIAEFRFDLDERYRG
jgi:hypothetical protein